MDDEPSANDSEPQQSENPEPPPDQATAQPKDPYGHGNRHSLALRIQCLTLIAENYRAEEIERKLGIAKRTIYHIKKRARDRGFDPDKDPRIFEKYVIDGPRPGRPRKSGVNEVVINRQPEELLENPENPGIPTNSGYTESSQIVS